MALPYRVPHLRGANNIAANPQHIGSPKDARWATGRYVKRSLPNRRYDGVEVWALKARAADGSVTIVATGRSREEAEQFVATGKW